MNISLWVVAGVLAVVFAASGVSKLVRSREALVHSGQGWAADTPRPLILAIGAAEVLAAVSLVVPPAIDVTPGLAPVAAAGLAALMLGAVLTHVRRRELPNAALAFVLGAAAAFVAVGRFGLETF